MKKQLEETGVARSTLYQIYDVETTRKNLIFYLKNKKLDLSKITSTDKKKVGSNLSVV